MKIIVKVKEKIYKLLKWSEKYTQTDMIYLAKGGGWLTFSQIVSTLLAFFLSVAFANLISKEIYGTYKYIISIFGFFSITTLPGIYVSLIQATSRKIEGNFLEATKKRILYGFLGSFGLIIISVYYFFHQNFLLVKAFLLASIFLPFFDSFTNYLALFNGRKRFDLLAKFQILAKIIPVLVLISILFFSNNLFLILIGYFFSYSLTRFLVWFFSINRYHLNFKKDSLVISYGKHLTLIQIFSHFANYLDKILVFHYLGATPLAIYHFATVIPDQFSNLLGNLRFLALPKFSEKNPQKIKKTLNKKILKFGILIALIVAGYILFCPLIYKIFFPQYQESVFYSKIFALSIFGVLGAIPYTFLLSQRVTKKLYQYNFLNAFFRIFFIFCGLYFWGLLGLVIARIISRIFNILLLEILIMRN